MWKKANCELKVWLLWTSASRVTKTIHFLKDKINKCRQNKNKESVPDIVWFKYSKYSASRIESYKTLQLTIPGNEKVSFKGKKEIYLTKSISCFFVWTAINVTKFSHIIVVIIVLYN